MEKVVGAGAGVGVGSVIVGVSASVPPLCPDTLFHVAGAALHLSMYLSEQLGPAAPARAVHRCLLAPRTSLF